MFFLSFSEISYEDRFRSSDGDAVCVRQVDCADAHGFREDDIFQCEMEAGADIVKNPCPVVKDVLEHFLDGLKGFLVLHRGRDGSPVWPESDHSLIPFSFIFS